MRGKLLFITGGLVGYVLGARAGRKRYDQIASVANDIWNAAPVQRRVNEARDFGLELVGDVPGMLVDAGKKIFSSASDKSGSGKAGSAAASRPAAGPRATPKSKPTSSAKPAASAGASSDDSSAN